MSDSFVMLPKEAGMTNIFRKLLLLYFSWFKQLLRHLSAKQNNQSKGLQYDSMHNSLPNIDTIICHYI